MNCITLKYGECMDDKQLYSIFFSTFEENYEQVSSSTENYRRVTEEPGMHELDQPYSDSVEKVCILSKSRILQHVSCFSAVLYNI